MFDNIKGMMSMMGQAKQMREKIAQLQEELGRKVVEGEAGAGAVRVRVNGRFEVVGMHLDRAMLLTLALPGDGAGPTDSDLRMIEDLIAAATNAALAKARELVKQELSAAASGLNLPGVPGLDKLMGG